MLPATITYDAVVPSMDEIQCDQLALEIARGGGVIAAVVCLLVPDGADEDQRAGINVNRVPLIAAQGVQRPKAGTLCLHVSTRQFF